MSVLKSDLAAVVEERASAQQRATDLQEQLRAQAETLQQVQMARDEQTSMVKGLEAELATLKSQHGHVVAGLQRLRHLARPAGRST